MELSKRALSVSPSLTLAITAKAKKMKAEGISIIGFGAGEPDFNTPKYIIDSAKVALDKGVTKYTPSSGTMDLKQAICKKFEKDNGLIYKPSQIVVSNGAKHSLFNAIQAVVDDGDEVIIPSPYWLTYPELVRLSGGTPVFVATTEENNYKMTATQLESAITNKTKAVIINSPSNPTGAVYSKEELYALAKVLENKEIWIISDEIYEKLVYTGNHTSIATYSDAIKEKTIVVNGVSKTYSMTGWRIGYLAGTEKVVKAIDGMQSHATSNPCSISQYATVTALSGGEDFLNEMITTFKTRRNFMIERIKEIKDVSIIKPDGAFYVMVNVSKYYGKKFRDTLINNSIDFSEMGLQKGIAVVPGSAFGDDSFVRLSYAISLDDIKIGLNRLEEYLSEIK